MDLQPMNFDEFENFLSQIEENLEVQEESDEIIPYAITFDSALREAKALLDDFMDEKDSTVMNVFEYNDGYQVDVISNHPEFEIYDHLYEGKDVAAQVFWDGDEKKVVEMKSS